MMRRMGVILRLLLTLAAVAVLLLALTFAAVLVTSSVMYEAHLDGRSLDQPVDAVIILGGGGYGDYAPPEVVHRRVLTGARMIARSLAKVAIISGGGKADTPYGDANELMRRRMTDAGTPPELILSEDRSLTTLQNMLFTREVLDANGLESVAIVTDSFHLLRAGLLAEHILERQVALVAPPNFDRLPLGFRIRVILRETLAWWYNIGKMIVWETMERAGYPVEQRLTVVG